MLDLLQRQRMLVGAGALLREAAHPRRIVLVQINQVDEDQPIGQAQGRLDRVGQALTDALAHDQPIDDDVDVVPEFLVQLGDLAEPMDPAVDPHPAEAPPPQLVQQLGVLPLPATHDRSEDLETGALVHGSHLVDDLLGRLGGDDGVAHGTVLNTGASVKQTQVVVDLGDRTHGRTRVAGGGLLVDRHRWRQALEEVDIGLVHLSEELSGVRGQGFDVAALALGEYRVEGQ